MLAIFAVSNSPIGFINAHLLFDPSSGYYRVWEWQIATDALSRSPWFGIAYGWPALAEQAGAVPSIDSIWLATALTYGYPCSYLLGLSFISAAFCRTSGLKINLTMAESRLGTTLTIVIFLILFLGFTVHFWGSAAIFISLLVGVKAHLGALGAKPYAIGRNAHITLTGPPGLLPVSTGRRL